MTPPAAVVVEVRGLPRPAGSKRVFLVGRKGAERRPVVVDDCVGGRDWRASVQHAIARQYPGAPLFGPLELYLSFTVLRPEGHVGRRGLRPSAPPYPARRPDLTKLVRAVEDAATGLLWHDDAQVVTQTATKRYGTMPGVVIECRRLAALEEGGEHARGDHAPTNCVGEEHDRAARDADSQEPSHASSRRRHRT
jgi:Holliday junction resolvase RusA-like endonuclease